MQAPPWTTTPAPARPLLRSVVEEGNKKRTFLQTPTCGLSCRMTKQTPISAAPAEGAEPHSTAESPAPGSARPRPGERWTPAKMTAFLRALSATHSVSAAASSVGMSRQSAYRLRTRAKGKAFDIAWDEAFCQSYQNLPFAALERAMNGVEVPHYYKGELIGTWRRYDERLTVALLKMAGNPNTLVVGGDQPFSARQGQRFASLLARIEAEGEDAPGSTEDTRPADAAAAHSADLSSMSDAQIMAELRRFERRKGG